MLWTWRTSLYILILSSYQTCALRIFSLVLYIAGLTFWLFSLLCNSFLVLYSSICLFLLSLPVFLKFISKKSLPWWLSWDFSFFPSNTFIRSLTFKSLIHFYLIFACGIRQWGEFVILHVEIQLFQLDLLKRLSFFLYAFLAPILKIS